MTLLYVALGSNLGDRAARVYAGIRGCVAHGLRLVELSPIYETEPVGGPPGQPPYLNAVAAFESGLSAGVVLSFLHQIEDAEGRVRAERFGERTLDLDLLVHGREIVQSESLTVPHPRLHERRFVLEPFAAIAPDLVVPGLDKTVAQLLEALDASEPQPRPSVRRYGVDAPVSRR